MSPLQALEGTVKGMPGLVSVYSSPVLPTGVHDLELRIDGRVIVVRWRSDLGFRIVELCEDDDAGFDSHPGIVELGTLEAASRHLQSLLRPPRASASTR